MKEPKRLLSHGATDFERQLLRAVANERPSALLRSRMQRGLGLVGPLAWASNVKAMFGTLGSRVTAGLVVTGVVVAGSVAAVTVGSFGSSRVSRNAETPQAAAPSAVTSGTSHAGTSQAESPDAVTGNGLPPNTRSPHSATSADAPAPVLASDGVEPGSADAARAQFPGSEAIAPARAAAPGTLGPALESEAAGQPRTGAADDVGAAPADDRQLREEIALLDAARAALQRGDREGARAALGRYRGRFPKGVLRREAKVLSGRAEAKPDSE